ncbi:MraY family glycosyltransferase [Defluviitalea phaphyphila]|uniref:hypothetical protein n=1 Tax=Defluviitalea phaphyphila TaxID=1473580 RepID=UPI0007308315|nr:hypothetical protein [Defluviitalea phaphyphila]
MILYLLGGIISFGISFFWKTLILEFLLNHNIKALNYKKKEIPVGTGILILLSTIISSFFLLFITNEPIMYFIYLFGFSLIGFAGILDDLVGENNIKGLKGHFGKMFKGELTSGGLKALIGGISSLFVAFSFSMDVFDLFINTLLISLFINAMNLFDVRPGRTIKVFIMISIIIWILSKNPDRFLTILLIGSIIPVIKGELREEYMLGDVGSNILGYTLGFTSAISLNLYTKIFFVMILILIHILGEITSITFLINKNPLLRYIDKLGQKNNG